MGCRSRYKIFSVLLLGSTVLLAGCGEKVSAPEPVRTAAPAFPTVPESHIRLRLTVPTQTLAARVNRMTAAKLLETDHQKVKCGIGKCHLSMLATRNGTIRLGGGPDGLHIILPFDAVAKLRLPGVFSTVKTRAHVTGTAEIASRLSLTSDGGLKTRSDGEVHLSGGNLRLGPVRTSLADIWNANADTLSRPIFHAMDKRISRAADSRGALQKLWRRAYQPIKVGHKPNIWLQVTPQALAAGDVSATDDTLSLPLELSFQARLRVMGDAPAVKPAAMPRLNSLKPGVAGYVVNLPVVLPYDAASDLALKALRKHPLHVAGYRIAVRGVQFLPSGQDMLLKSDFCAGQGWDFLHLFGACGTVYFRGVPYYDAGTESIRMRNLKYDLKTESLLLNSLQALAGESFGKALEKSVHLSLSRKIRDVRGHLQTAFATGTKGTVHFSGTLTDFTPYALHWTDSGFVALVRAGGKAELSVRP